MGSISPAIVYLTTLRKARELSQSQVAEAVQVEMNQVSRWETGKAKPSAETFMALIKAVRGSLEHVQELSINKNATPEDARKMALQWLDQEAMNYINGQLDAIPDNRVGEALEIVRDLQKSNKIDQLVNFGRYLRNR